MHCQSGDWRHIPVFAFSIMYFLKKDNREGIILFSLSAMIISCIGSPPELGGKNSVLFFCDLLLGLCLSLSVMVYCKLWWDFVVLNYIQNVPLFRRELLCSLLSIYTYVSQTSDLMGRLSDQSIRTAFLHHTLL